MTELFENYCHGPSAVARLLTIYIDEAHPQNEWFFPQAPDVLTGEAIIPSHQTIEDRLAAAKKFAAVKQFKMDLVADSMEGHIVDRYLAWPERLYIIVDGVIVYMGGNGPFGYRLDEVQRWLAERYGMRGRNLDKNI